MKACGINTTLETNQLKKKLDRSSHSDREITTEYVTIYGRKPLANLTRKIWQVQLRKEL
jgi:hypothetical protein